jgi:hypothetical protein
VLIPNADPFASEVAELRAELRNSQNERMLMAAQLRQVSVERNYHQNELERVEKLLADEQGQVVALREELERLRANYEAERITRIAMQQSRSWQLTRPLRGLLTVLKGKRELPAG